MKFGSSLRIEIKNAWSESPTKIFYATLSDTPNSDAALRQTFKQIEDWIHNTARVARRTADLSDAQLLEAAIARGLIPANVDTRPVPELYYVASRSGDTNGHYIEMFKDGIRCSCPGFVNNAKCWATTQVINRNTSPSATTYQRNLDKWSASRENFYYNRGRDYPDLMPGSSVVRALV